MKKLFLLFAVALSSLLLNAQTNQVVWLNGKVFYQHPVTAVDSITYDMNNMITGDTLKLIMPRATKEIVYKEIHDTIYIYECHDEKLLDGAFSVSVGKQVAFTKGNLQYIKSTNTWSFAENQYEMLGTANVSGDALADKIDLFGWSANNETAQWGISTSTDNTDYAGDFVDWSTNTIASSVQNTYRTLTKDEWYYLRNTRTNADSLIGVARIELSDSEYANGLVLLPDNWQCPESLKFKSGFESTCSIEAYATHQTFTLADWLKLEAAGAVFLPASGYRNGASVNRVQDYGHYWSATAGDSNYAFGMNFYSDKSDTYGDGRTNGRALRLVKDL